LTKAGAGTLTLSALNSYRGDTTVLDGVLEITGGIYADGTTLIDIQSGVAKLMTTNVSKADLDIRTDETGTLEIVSGTHAIRTIMGEGTTRIDGGATLRVASLVQGTLIIGAGANKTMAVPEPSGGMLIGSGLFLLLAVQRIRRRSARG
jgi:autotransporter-associated beta strand protein